jgi:uncharacterized membrane protein/catechol 2,3-dioxygenase-like lactoylglutathione lyase family enzyme
MTEISGRTATVAPVAGDGAEAAGPVEISTDRLEAFSDGVFSIAITLLVLDLQPDHSKPLAQALGQLWPNYVGYVVSFLLIGVVWLNHHTMFHYIRRVDRRLLVLNLLLLLSVAFLPLPTSVLAHAIHTGHGKNVAAGFYGGTLVIGGIFFNAIWYYASTGHRHLGNHISPWTARQIRNRFVMGPLLYLAATLVGLLVSAEASLVMYALLLVFYMFEATTGQSARWLRRGRRAPGRPAWCRRVAGGSPPTSTFYRLSQERQQAFLTALTHGDRPAPRRQARMDNVPTPATRTAPAGGESLFGGPAGPTLERVSACVAVADLGKALAWYADALGFTPVRAAEFPELPARVAYVEGHGARLELAETRPSTPARRPDPPAHGRVQGISQLTFYVDDLDKVVAWAEAHQVEVAMWPVAVADLALRAAFIRDCDGNLIEFIQEAPQAPDSGRPAPWPAAGAAQPRATPAQVAYQEGDRP